MADDSHGAPLLESEGRPHHDAFPDGQPIVIRLAPDYTGRGWVPLWPSSDDTDALVPPDLLQRLIAWSDLFQGSYHYERGWQSDEVRDRWAAEGAELAAELRSVLDGKAELVVDLWPLSERQ